MPTPKARLAGDEVGSCCASPTNFTIDGPAERRFVRATLLHSDLLMRSLGRPNREQVVTTRPDTLTTLQALDLTNGPILADMLNRPAGADKTAEKIGFAMATALAGLVVHLSIDLGAVQGVQQFAVAGRHFQCGKHPTTLIFRQVNGRNIAH